MNPNLQFIVYDRSQEQGRIQWQGQRLVIGRRADADIRVNEPTMSGIHAEIVATQEGVVIRDLESLNGTQLNGVRINHSILRIGDQVQIGRSRIVVSNPDFLTEPTSTPTVEDLLTSESQNSQTVKIRLDHLRDNRPKEIEDDTRIFLLRDLSETLKSLESPTEILEKARRVLSQAFERSRAFVFLREGDSWSSLSHDGEERRPSMTFVEETAASMSAILSTSLPEDQRFSASESARISGIETAMAAPTSQDGAPVAVFYVDRLGLPPFNLRDLSVLGIAANHVSAVLENASRFAELRRTNAELMQARENLAQLNHNLEQLVEERTAEIRRQAEEIQTLADAKDELMGMAAHDIRGPLTVIQGTADLLKLRLSRNAGSNNGEKLDGLAKSLDMIHGAARGLGRLLSELLDSKAIESGKITLRRRRAPITEIVAVALPVPKLAAEEKNISLISEIDETAYLWADPQRLAQAIINLMLNAVKFSDSGSKIVFRGSKTDDDRRVVLEVEDHGLGIPDEELEKIFGTFEQGEAGRRYGGSGLGLMIARRLVELHDGTLTVHSQVGVGSRFIMTFPSCAHPKASDLNSESSTLANG